MGGEAPNNVGAGGSILGALTMPLLFIVFMYFLIIRPQRKRQQQHQELVNSVTVGETVTTSGGIVGKVINIKDDEVVIETSVERTQIKIKKWAISDVERLEEE
ncbi:MAG TPA: preprotein translocase subunit YajC [Ruminiclostridium sp.]|jgi:preprotein translocase subunit YajC|uniref:Preprotein translocase subunit YajC n=1 Tax=Acetivibrio saccincola TaxID=1677857 RepID=A0A2K9E5S7_9FIRM|nr:preprotein translocase subunit YajC [Acetivibrio saccincola]HAA43365.1 preprotein translocase subunit YajC [Ruminiclostridium sp.]AUG57728.1 preprotein translocase subunit YajC [Acetivibrio saccincola]NLW27868.1 preprotein translocase subunit YajC [Acetivibrio saccincola]PQQ67619.1 preprotein translocase subunit YajC [Acetivibrio saccincola]HOA98040.1 preprotein translocase subunit YajC [Acetivibrio saccincola]